LSKKKIIANLLAFILGAVLIVFGIKLFITEDQINLLKSSELYVHFYSILIFLPIAFIGGVETWAIFKIMYNKNISIYDVFTLPFVIAFWGILIPVQGAYFYNSLYFKKKYNISVKNTTSVFLLSLSFSTVISGVLGLFYIFFIQYDFIFFTLSVITVIHPIFIKLLLLIVKKTKFNAHPLLLRIIDFIEIIFTDYFRSLKGNLAIAIIGLNIINSIITAILYMWISANYSISLNFFQLLILSFLIKLTLLLKFTPGNIGINQFASSGIIVLVGGTASAGFILSLYQTLIFIITAIVFGAIFTIVNLPYFINYKYETQ
jgi:hypothetical protein